MEEKGGKQKLAKRMGKYREYKMGQVDHSVIRSFFACGVSRYGPAGTWGTWEQFRPGMETIGKSKHMLKLDYICQTAQLPNCQSQFLFVLVFRICPIIPMELSSCQAFSAKAFAVESWNRDGDEHFEQNRD